MLSVLPPKKLLANTKPVPTFAPVAVPVVPSTSMPNGHPIITELNQDISEFLLICAPALYNELPMLVAVALGPIAVILLNTTDVFGVTVVPPALLSLSNASDLEASAINESLIAKPNCTLPL